MATVHYLFFGIFYMALLFVGGFSDYTLVRREFTKNRYELGSVYDKPEKFTVQQKVRSAIVDIAVAEIGVSEMTGNNDGRRVEEYLAYTGLGKGYSWCAAFVSWCFSRAGLSFPRNAWSPALFPLSRRYTKLQIRRGEVRPADLFAIYNQKLGRIDHVGIVRKSDDKYILTVEGNVENRALSKRRALVTIYAFANWLD